MTSIEQKCRVREKGTKIVTEELQQRIVAKSAKCERYEARCGKNPPGHAQKYELEGIVCWTGVGGK